MVPGRQPTSASKEFVDIAWALTILVCMKGTHGSLYLLALGILILSSCGTGRLDTDLSPPPETASARDLIPTEIGGLSPSVSAIDVPNHIVEAWEADYDSGAYVIRIIKGQDVTAAFDYARREGERFFVPIRHTKIFNREDRFPYWEAVGSDEQDGYWVAWTNDRWMFFLGGVDESHLDRLIELFPYIDGWQDQDN